MVGSDGVTTTVYVPLEIGSRSWPETLACTAEVDRTTPGSRSLAPLADKLSSPGKAADPRRTESCSA